MISQKAKKHLVKTLVVFSLFNGSLASSVQAEAATALTRFGVNFRTGPSTNYRVIRTISASPPPA